MKSEILECLRAHGTVNIRGKCVKLSIPDGTEANRKSVLHRLTDDLKSYDAVQRTDRPNFSRIGYLDVAGYKISVKPQHRQSTSAPGLQNETLLAETIRRYLDYTDRIVFYTNEKEYVCEDVRQCLLVSGNKPKLLQRCKTDVRLLARTGFFNFSVKQDDAEKWESADEMYGETARLAIQKAVESGTAVLSHVKDSSGNPIFLRNNPLLPVMRIDPQLYIHMDISEQSEVVFGQDILNRGAVLVRSFSESDFSFENNSLWVFCSKLYTQIEDVGEQEKPHLIVRNDAARNSLRVGISGIRVEAVHKSRVKNAIEVR